MKEEFDSRPSPNYKCKRHAFLSDRKPETEEKNFDTSIMAQFML